MSDKEIHEIQAKVEKEAAEAQEERSLLNSFQVRQEVYEGPFDLMLAMIEKGDLDLYKVSLSDITMRFIEYIKSMQQVNILVGAEFLLMAAYMLEMKSKKLLPEPPKLLQEDSLIDVEQELLERLAEYKIYKNLAHSLKERKEVFQRVYTRYAPEEALEDQEIFLVDVSLKDLVSAFQRVWQLAEKAETTREIVQENFSVKEKIVEIEKMLEENPKGLSFNALFVRYIKLEIIVTFLAVLELMKRKTIKIMQNENFSDIFLFRNTGEPVNG
jgi:segregation and condensation protein A